MSEDIVERMPDRMSGDMSERLSEDMSERLSGRMSKDLSERQEISRKNVRKNFKACQ